MGTTIQDNPVVKMGWETVRNLANVALVFGLVAVAISIILGFQETKAKKALINFVGIALLINFTPVIAGVMIDFANKLMGLFLTSGINYDMAKIILEGLRSKSFTFDDPIFPIAYLLFAIFATVIYFLYAFIFLARHIVLWILVIVSPIAFASKVFPEGKYLQKIFPSITYWDEWWNNFLQWTVIGIPASFSLYLSNKTMATMAISPLVSEPGGRLVGLGGLLGLIVPLAFLVVGFFITVSSGGQIAEMATGYGRQAFGRLTAAGAGFATGAYAGAKTQAALTKDDGLAKRAAYVLGGGLYGGTKTGVKEALTAKVDEKSRVASTAGLTGMIKSPLERTEGAKQWVTRRKEDIGLEKPGTAAGMEEKEFKQFKEPMENLTTDGLRRISGITPMTREDNIKKHMALQILMEKKDLNDGEIDYLTKNIKTAGNYGFSKKEFAKFVPQEAEKLTDGKQTTADIMSKMSAKEKQEKIRTDSLTNIFVAANLTEKDRKYFDERGTQQQRDALQNPSTFDGFDFEKHVTGLNQRQIYNLFKNLSEEQKEAVKSNKIWTAQANAKIQELNNLTTTEAKNMKKEITKKLDIITNSIS